MKRIINKKIFFVLFSLMLFSFVKAQVGINIQEPRTMLDVNGDLTIRETHYLSKDPQALYIDSDGKIGLRPIGNVLTDKAFFATNDAIILNNIVTPFNNGTVIELPFSANDIVYNTIGIENVGRYFKITEDGYYQIDGFINFYIGTAFGNYTFLVVRIEVSEDNGQTWNLITGSSSVFVHSWIGSEQNHPHNIPAAMSFLPSGSLLRISFHRSFKEGVPSQGQGSPVQYIQISSDFNYATKSYQIGIEKL